MGSLGDWLQLIIGSVGTFILICVIVMTGRLYGRTDSDVEPDGTLTPAALSNQRSRKLLVRVQAILLGGIGASALLALCVVRPLGGSKGLQVSVFLLGALSALVAVVVVAIRADRSRRANPTL
jgi:hypothetical protein